MICISYINHEKFDIKILQTQKPSDDIIALFSLQQIPMPRRRKISWCFEPSTWDTASSIFKLEGLPGRQMQHGSHSSLGRTVKEMSVAYTIRPNQVRCEHVGFVPWRWMTGFGCMKASLATDRCPDPSRTHSTRCHPHSNRHPKLSNGG